MEDLIARARLVDTSELGASGVTATVPRRDVEAALAADEGPADLILDVERIDDGGGRRIAVEWDREDLERLLRQAEDDAIVFAFDREPLQRAFEDPDVEGHGLREKALVLTVAAATAAGAAGAANAVPDMGGAGAATSGPAAHYAVEQTRGGVGAAEEVRQYGLPQPTAADYAAAQGVEAGQYGMPQATAADYAAAQGVEEGQYGMPQVSHAEALAAPGDMGEAMQTFRLAEQTGAEGAASGAASIEAARSAEIAPAAGDMGEAMQTFRLAEQTGAEGAASGAASIEAARSAETTAGELAAGYAGIETVGAEVAAELGTGQGPAEYTALESARATEPAPTTGDATGSSFTVEAPSPGQAAGLAGAVALAITGAAFMARSRRRLTPQG